MQVYQPKIFISSTIRDMPNEREAALQAVKIIGGEPLMSEYTINAQSSDSVTTCLDKVRQSNIYILILGGVYGWQPFNDKSITELEYLTAQENNIPTLVFNTDYSKDELQEDFSKKVGATFFWKPVKNAFELKVSIQNSIREEIDKWALEAKENTELIYSNLLNISFPDTVYIADLNLNRKEIIESSWGTERALKMDASWYDVTVAAIHQKNIKFPHDWNCHGGKLITFHDLSDHHLPLADIIDLGTVTPLSCDEFYDESEDALRVFKALLRNCLKTKLYKLKINWFKSEKLFVFMPVVKDHLGKWKNREITWQRKNKATRTVVKCSYKKDEPFELRNIWHLSFATDFYHFEDKWYMTVKPDWLITYADFRVSWFASKYIAAQKRLEKNIHVFNHLNFILWYLQPDDSMVMFQEYADYKFLKIESFNTLDSYPIIPDEEWRKLESKSLINKLLDSSGPVELFTK